MQSLTTQYRTIAKSLEGPVASGLALLLTRVSLAGVFWRSGRTKVEDGTLLQVSESTKLLFEYEYAGLPIPADIAAPLATYGEFFLPLLLFAGLASRIGAFGILIMTLVIQFFVFPEAWWQVHALWAAMAAVIIAKGPGIFSLDTLFARNADRSNGNAPAQPVGREALA